MADTKKYIKKIKTVDGTIHYIYDEGAARKEDLNDYFPVTGGDITGDVSIYGSTNIAGDTNIGDYIKLSTDGTVEAKSIKATDLTERTTTIDNVITLDEDTNELQYRDACKVLEDIGGIGGSYVSEEGIYSLFLGRKHEIITDATYEELAGVPTVFILADK